MIRSITLIIDIWLNVPLTLNIQERPTMIKYKIENIRDLFGHKADLPRQRNAPIALYNQLV